MQNGSVVVVVPNVPIESLLDLAKNVVINSAQNVTRTHTLQAQGGRIHIRISVLLIVQSVRICWRSAGVLAGKYIS